jgi:hypothetical protein
MTQSRRRLASISSTNARASSAVGGGDGVGERVADGALEGGSGGRLGQIGRGGSPPQAATTTTTVSEKARYPFVTLPE